MLDHINAHYQKSCYSDITVEINGLSIPLNNQWKSIGIAMSGGADSTLLAYLLCSLLEDRRSKCEIHVISNVRNWKSKPWQADISTKVFDSIKTRFQTLKFYRHENFVPPEFEHGVEGKKYKDEYGKLVSGDTLELRAFAEYIGHKHNLDAYYNAVTKNPDHIENGLPARNLDIDTDNFRLMIMHHMNMIVCHPFRFITKSWIIDTYRKLNIMNLFETTRSCEGDNEFYPEIFKGLNYTNYTEHTKVPICGKCFWCKEREWAVEQSK